MGSGTFWVSWCSASFPLQPCCALSGWLSTPPPTSVPTLLQGLVSAGAGPGGSASRTLSASGRGAAARSTLARGSGQQLSAASLEGAGRQLQAASGRAPAAAMADAGRQLQAASGRAPIAAMAGAAVADSAREQHQVQPQAVAASGGKKWDVLSLLLAPVAPLLASLAAAGHSDGGGKDARGNKYDMLLDLLSQAAAAPGVQVGWAWAGCGCVGSTSCVLRLGGMLLKLATLVLCRPYWQPHRTRLGRKRLSPSTPPPCCTAGGQPV